MQNEEPRSTELDQREGLSPGGRDRIVELLAAGLERFLREASTEADSLTSSDDICLYHDRADVPETDNA
jgi:hypothetical protein